MTSDAPFGNAVLSFEIEGVAARLVRDRGSVFIDVSDGREWHALRNLFAFVEGWGAVETARRPEPPFEAVAGRWAEISAALTDERLPAYEQAIGAAVMDRLSSARAVAAE